MPDDSATVNIPKDVIEPIIEAKVQAAVLDALGGHEAILSKAVVRVLNTKVGSDGEPDRYGNAKETWLSWMLTGCLRNAVKSAIETAMANNEKAIRAQLVTELQKKNSPLIRQLVNAMTGCLTDPDALRYRLSVQVEPKGA